MRLRFTLAFVACAALVACAGTALARTDATGGGRVFKQYVTTPGQFDLTLAEITFTRRPHVAGAGASGGHHVTPIRLALLGPLGLDYVAGAVTRFAVGGRPRVLVLVVNRRPRGSLAPDLARIGLAVTAARGLGAPAMLAILNPFSRPASGLTPALCDLPIRGPSLAGGDLRSVLSRGLPLTGARAGGAVKFSPDAAIAQAYDAVCGKPYDAAFRQAVTQGSSPSCEGAGAGVVPCCPPNAMCAAPPCPPCPCTGLGCRVPLAASGPTAIVCPLQSQPIACPL
ncbi:MAG: hypothetical protein JWO21_159 [Solirubrobacterales bacterium]|jgi:hypothetical protein|nr:hypothetical protein [Solirubrobacterales bacterium]